MVKRGMRRNITSGRPISPGVECFGEFWEIYRINATTGGELRAEPWGPE